jgi:hypothetical protein
MKFEKIKRVSGDLFIPRKREGLRVRYSNINGSKTKAHKNTLLTMSKNDLIFFGIARCNLESGDKFSKKMGKALAVERLLAIRTGFLDGGDISTTGLYRSRNMLSGWCTVDSVSELLKHFHAIDETIDKARRQKYERKE